MATQSVKINRLKLIEQLKEAQRDNEAKVAEYNSTRFLERIASLNRQIEQAQSEIAELRLSGKSQWFKNAQPDQSLAKAIRLLELSDEEVILVRSSSDLYKYL